MLLVAQVEEPNTEISWNMTKLDRPFLPICFYDVKFVTTVYDQTPNYQEIMWPDTIN